MLPDGDYVVVSDIQAPFHDQRAVDAVCAFVKDFRPAGILNVGDDADMHEISRWVKGLPGEGAGTLQEGLDSAQDQHVRFRRALGKTKPYHVMRSNHTDRLLQYVERDAKGLMGLRDLRLGSDNVLGYDRLGITYHEQVWEFAPGWLLAHGDERGGVSNQAGLTALKLALALGKSVVCGHTHRQAMKPETAAVAGKVVRTVWGVEVGNLMDMGSADYLKAGGANWQQGFAVLRIRNKRVQPFLVPIEGGQFITPDGKVYRV